MAVKANHSGERELHPRPFHRKGKTLLGGLPDDCGLHELVTREQTFFDYTTIIYQGLRRLKSGKPSRTNRQVNILPWFHRINFLYRCWSGICPVPRTGINEIRKSDGMHKKTASCWTVKASQYENERDRMPYGLTCRFRKVIHMYSTSLVDIRLITTKYYLFNI